MFTRSTHIAHHRANTFENPLKLITRYLQQEVGYGRAIIMLLALIWFEFSLYDYSFTEYWSF